jgi:DNA-binding PadR family transcriptional regulator
MRRIKRGIFRAKILAIIIKHGEIHGYGIYKDLLGYIRDHPYITKPSLGTIYRLLNQLVLEGYVERKVISRNGRRAIYYKATNKGIEEFLRITESFLDRTTVGLALVVSTLKQLDERGIDTLSIKEKLYKIRRLLEINDKNGGPAGI